MIAAHLIVGRAEEPFLPATLASLEGVVAHVIVNDNSQEPHGANARVLAECSFAQRSALTIDRSRFVDFATARNCTLARHREIAPGGWAAFIDADEVHRPIAATIARNLAQLGPHIATVDAYTRHYFQSFKLYTSIERRLAFFRVTPDVHWSGRVHERLAGLVGTRLVLPYVYDHYGALTTVQHQAAKGRLYAALGQAGSTLAQADEDRVTLHDIFLDYWPLVLRYNGTHSAAVSALRSTLEGTHGERYERSEEIVAQFSSPLLRLRNTLRRLNFEYRWRARALDPRARRMMQDATA